MLQNKKTVLICARGLDYGEGGFPESVYHFQASYLKAWLNFIGVEDISVIKVEQTLMGSDKRDASLKKACEEAISLSR